MDERAVRLPEVPVAVSHPDIGHHRSSSLRDGRLARCAALLLFALVMGATHLATTASPLGAQAGNGNSAANGVLAGERGAGSFATVDHAAAETTARTVRIALQAGHWRAHEAPDELARLRSNGTRGGGVEAWEVTLQIARLAADLLEAKGYEVEILPATVPVGYRADLFIAIHADGFHSPAASGFSISPPRRDATGRGAAFAQVLAGEYRETTGLRHRQATRRMAGYYAFNSRRYRHAIDPSTPAVILEAGFLTSPSDQELLIRNPDRAARGISQAVARFLPLGVVAESNDDR